jgi:predicted ArsR family transcriptional regulator
MTHGFSKRFLETTRGQVVALLRRGPRTVEELARELGLTDNGVRTHLATLERDGLVRQEGVRRPPGAGKPAVVYNLDPAAEPLFSRAYPAVLSEVLDVVVESLPAAQAAEMLERVGRRLGVALGGPAAGSMRERAEAAATALRELGGDVDVTAEDGVLRLRSAGCPLSFAVSRRPETCRAVEAMVSQMVGSPARECCERGERPRCCFTIEPAA